MTVKIKENVNCSVSRIIYYPLMLTFAHDRVAAVYSQLTSPARMNLITSKQHPQEKKLKCCAGKFEQKEFNRAHRVLIRRLIRRSAQDYETIKDRKITSGLVKLRRVNFFFPTLSEEKREGAPITRCVNAINPFFFSFSMSSRCRASL